MVEAKESMVAVADETKKLVNAMKQIQEIYKLNDRQFSIRLKIDQSHYSKIRRGLIPVGGKVLNALAREFPESKLAVYEYLTRAATPAEAIKP